MLRHGGGFLVWSPLPYHTEGEEAAALIPSEDQLILGQSRSISGNIEDDLVVNYFDKLIQIPIRVPPLGTQEVRAYMMLLFIEAAC